MMVPKNFMGDRSPSKKFEEYQNVYEIIT